MLLNPTSRFRFIQLSTLLIPQKMWLSHFLTNFRGYRGILGDFTGLLGYKCQPFGVGLQTTLRCKNGQKRLVFHLKKVKNNESRPLSWSGSVGSDDQIWTGEWRFCRTLSYHSKTLVFPGFFEGLSPNNHCGNHYGNHCNQHFPPCITTFQSFFCISRAVMLIFLISIVLIALSPL